MLAHKAITTSLRSLSRVAPKLYDRGQLAAMYATPEVFVREALWRIAHPNNELIGDAGRDPQDVLQFLSFAAPLVPQASSQFFQDLWALWESNNKRSGYFVEFGATDGKFCSNTFFLEKNMGWSGIVAEPHPMFSESLKQNRSCRISTKIVYSESGKMLDFVALDAGSYAHIADEQSKGPVVKIETVSLNDLLIECDAPREVDFLSVDTEGSEFEILSAFDFDRWHIRCIAVEHNHTANREKLFGLLTSRGFRRKWPSMGHVDDWYVRDRR
jgi:FkbM family methyltransferase